MTPVPNFDPATLDEALEIMVAKASSDEIRAKLRNLHDVCKTLILDGGIKPTVTAVVTQYKLTFGPHMAESSLRNKRDGKNPYKELYDLWELQARARGSSRRRPGEVISVKELASIRDHDLRHRVALTMADNHHLRSKVNILQTANGQGTIVVEGMEPRGSSRLPKSTQVPDARDLDEIRDFLGRYRERGLVKRADRALATMDGRLVADPGFLDALERIAADG